MPITTAWIAHSCWVTSRYFWTLQMFLQQQCEFPQWVKPPAISCSVLHLLLNKTENITPCTAMRQDFYHIPSLPEAGAKQKSTIRYHITFLNCYQLQISERNATTFIISSSKWHIQKTEKLFFFLNVIWDSPEEGNSCSAAADAVLLRPQAWRRCDSWACAAMSHSHTLLYRKSLW